jgi:internalin A
MSELALKLIKEAKEKRLTRLDLGNCGLTELPDELFELVWLKYLFIMDEYKEPDGHEELDYKSLNLNSINHLSERISNLKELITLKISGGSSSNIFKTNSLFLAPPSVFSAFCVLSYGF